ncbi:hypothetical protein CFAL_11960 (plasmid) [Corynebacterium falsenii DSM 44353]|uniref:hypothetical protein n=1 Tax=Corynebacterium falsenii TaxID=108486 RepID=UPI0003E95F39|nr:hypothetical protein [Corynebacterium falsenii]AHI04387.1 hypothetical protein CFAL_09765 [Corynebacterium falsenii DSM 44353]AHI04469.1 hypothetical protein CFAL_11960 [Corynebacterium falsenii DSM 44353]UBI04597.1 hypothetical protein LA343_11600 [Corynebacterium falsenii]
MTTNYQRAYDIIAEGIAAEDHPGDITQQLHTTGTIAPDLPEPTIENGEPTWELGSYFDDVMILDEMVCVGVNTTYGVPLDLGESEALALALLAAIKHQKENRHES